MKGGNLAITDHFKFRLGQKVRICGKRETRMIIGLLKEKTTNGTVYAYRVAFFTYAGVLNDIAACTEECPEEAT